MEELSNLLGGKMGLDEDVINAIAAAWSDYKLNFTDTKADKEISKEENMALTEFLNGLGLDEKTVSVLVDNYFRDGMAQFKMQMAERNAKAEVTKEEQEMIGSFVKEMGLTEDAIKILQEKLFNYKRLFSETEPSKELTDEEIETLTALIEELGGKVDEKVIEKLGMQWIDYKMMLLKTMG